MKKNKTRNILYGKPTEEEILQIRTEFDEYYYIAMSHAKDILEPESKMGMKAK